MTEQEQQELRYLISLTLAASEWRVSEDQAEVDPLRLEVTQRLNRLQGIEPEIIDGREQSVVERGLAKAEAKKAKVKVINVDKPNTIRVRFPDGSMHRVATEDLRQEPYLQSPTGMHWVIKDERLAYYCDKYGVKA